MDRLAVAPRLGVVMSFLFAFQLLDWAMGVLKFHAERKSVLEVCVCPSFTLEFSLLTGNN